MHQEYIRHPQVNKGEPIPVYETGKLVPGSPLWEMAQNTPTAYEVYILGITQKENSTSLTAATAER